MPFQACQKMWITLKSTSSPFTCCMQVLAYRESQLTIIIGFKSQKLDGTVRCYKHDAIREDKDNKKQVQSNSSNFARQVKCTNQAFPPQGVICWDEASSSPHVESDRPNIEIEMSLCHFHYSVIIECNAPIAYMHSKVAKKVLVYSI